MAANRCPTCASGPSSVRRRRTASCRASLRAVDERKSTPYETIHSFTHREPLTPGQITEIRVSFATVGHVARAGHRLELSIVAPPSTPNPIWGFATREGAARITVHHPSHLRLPVLQGEEANAAAPAPGRLLNQPVRYPNNSPAT